MDFLMNPLEVGNELIRIEQTSSRAQLNGVCGICCVTLTQ